MPSKIRCEICGFDSQRALEHHHIIPRRHGGPDTEDNLVTLCANCHRAIESIYNESFWQTVLGDEEQEQQVDLESTIAEFASACLRDAPGKTLRTRTAYESFKILTGEEIAHATFTRLLKDEANLKQTNTRIGDAGMQRVFTDVALPPRYHPDTTPYRDDSYEMDVDLRAFDEEIVDVVESE